MRAAVKELELELPSDPRVVEEVRRRLEAFLRDAPLGDEELHEVKVAVSEACANAISHGSPLGPANCFRLAVALFDRELVIEVEDEGDGFPARPCRLEDADGLSTAGRGIFLMRHLCDHVDLTRSPRGALVRLRKRLPRVSQPERVPAMAASPG